MSKEFTITLDGKDYSLTPFNMEQLERVAELGVSGLHPTKVAFATFHIAMENATPKIEDSRKLVVGQAEFQDAMSKVMTAAGMTKPEEADQGEATPPAVGAA